MLAGAVLQSTLSSCDFSPKLAINPLKLDIYIRTIKNAYETHKGHSNLCHWGFLEATLRPFRGHLEADYSLNFAINPWKLDIYIRKIKNAYRTYKRHKASVNEAF